MYCVISNRRVQLFGENGNFQFVSTGNKHPVLSSLSSLSKTQYHYIVHSLKCFSLSLLPSQPTEVISSLKFRPKTRVFRVQEMITLTLTLHLTFFL